MSKKGISLVALVITIIVLIVLTTTVIMSLNGDNSVITKSKEAVFKSDIKTLIEDFNIKKLDVQSKNGGTFDPNTIIASAQQGNIKDWIPSITDAYINKIFIENGIFKADKSKFNEEELAWLADLGILATSIVPVVGKTSDWVLDETKTVIIQYAGPKITSSFTIPKQIKDEVTNEIYTIERVGNGIDPVFPNNSYNYYLPQLTISSNLIITQTVFFPANKIIVGNNVTFEGDFLKWSAGTLGAQYPLEVVMGNDITVNGYFIYNCEKLKSVEIGNNANFEGMTIKYCDVLKSVEIGDNFYCGSLSAISNNELLESIKIGDNATINQNAFGSNNNLRKITIGKELSIIGSLNDINRICKNDPLLEEIIVESFKDVGKNGMYDCVALKNVTIADGGTLADNAFTNCTGITDVTVGALGKINGTTLSSVNAFANCTGIKNVRLLSGSGQNNPSSMFNGKTSIENVIIEDNATLNTSIFQGCTSLSNVTIGNNVKFVANAFNGCTALESVVIKSGSILSSTGAFMNCTNLSNIIIEEGVTNSGVAGGANMFRGCTGLQSITIPSTITDIKGGMFFGCTNLSSITINEGTGGTGLKTIGSNSFAGTAIISITIPSTIETISNYAFSNTSSLTTIRINKSRSEVEAMDGYSTKWGATNATILCQGEY